MIRSCMPDEKINCLLRAQAFVPHSDALFSGLRLVTLLFIWFGKEEGYKQIVI